MVLRHISKRLPTRDIFHSPKKSGVQMRHLIGEFVEETRHAFIDGSASGLVHVKSISHIGRD